MAQITKPTVGATGWNTATDALIDRHNTLDGAGGAATVAALTAATAATTALDTRVTTLEALPAAGDSDVVWSQLVALPHVVVSTASGVDPTTTETYLDATITVNGVVPFSGTTQIRGRGNSTFTAEKKPWRLQLTTPGTTLLGMPLERSWAMLANYFDPSKLRNEIAFEMARRCSGLAWTPRSRMVELTMNGTYRGTYQLCEHVERGTNKININAASGTSGLTLTGGYTLEIDRRYIDNGDTGFTTSLGVMVAMDDPDGTVPQHKTYIEDWVQTFEDALMGDDWLDATLGYAQYIDMTSWVDWYIVNELCSTLDANEFSSIKMYKTRDVTGTPGRLYLGPTWDHDNSLNNSFGDDQAPTGSWVLESSEGGVHPGFRWLARMVDDPTFFALLVSRWATFKAAITTGDSIFAVIDRLTDRLTYAVARDARRWESADDILADIDDMKTWLQERIDWLSTVWVVDTEDPTVPTGLSAAPGDGQVVLSWSASTDDVTVSGYRVRRDGSLIASPSGTGYTDTGRTNGVTYGYTVAAFDAAGNESAETSEVEATPEVSADLPDPLIDLDPNTISGSNGAAVASLPDVSGNARHFVQATTDDQPTLVTAAINGRKAVNFDGDLMGNTATGIAAGAAFTLCMVISMTGVPADTNSGILSSGEVGVGSDFLTDGRWYIGHPTSTGETTFTSLVAGGSLVTTGDAQIVTSSRAFGQYVLVTITAGSDGVDLVARVNGVAETAVTGRDAPDLLFGRLYLGSRTFQGGGHVQRCRFHLARLRLYAGRLGGTDRDAVEDDLAALFGITLP